MAQRNLLPAAFLMAVGWSCYLPGQVEERKDIGAPGTRSGGAKELDEIAAVVGGVAAEFACDVLLRLASAPGSPQTEQRKLLEEAFARSWPIRQRYPLSVAADGLEESRPRFQALASDMQLDRLSMQCRIVKGMSVLDPVRARELFSEIGAFEFPQPACPDSLVPDFSLFYQTLADVHRLGFSAAERRRRDDVTFVEGYLRGIHSSLQLAPAAGLVSSLKVGPEERALLLAAYAAAMAQITDSDRVFSFVIGGPRLTDRVLDLAAAAKREGASVGPLLQVLRQYLVRHFEAKRCADTVESELVWKGVNDPVRAFNERGRSLQGDLPPLIPDKELWRAGTGSRPSFRPYWAGTGAGQLFERFKSLLGKMSGVRLEENETLNREWQQTAWSLLGDVEKWPGDPGDEGADVFHKKSSMYHGFLNFLPEGELHRRISHSYVSFLSQHAMQRESPIEWRLHVERLLKLARPFSDEGKKELEVALKQGIRIPGLPHGGGTAILDELERSADPVLALYGRLERVLPEARATWRR